MADTSRPIRQPSVNPFLFWDTGRACVRTLFWMAAIAGFVTHTGYKMGTTRDIAADVDVRQKFARAKMPILFRIPDCVGVVSGATSEPQQRNLYTTPKCSSHAKNIAARKALLALARKNHN